MSNSKVIDTDENGGVTAMLGPVRLAYTNGLFERDDKSGKFSVRIMAEKGTEAAKVLAQAFKEAANFGGKKQGKLTLKDGDAKDETGEYLHPDVYRGYLFLTSRSNFELELFAGRDRRKATPADFWDGVNAAVVLTVKKYNANGNQGVTAYLGPIVSLLHGEKITVAGKAAFANAALDSILGDMEIGTGEDSIVDADQEAFDDLFATGD